MLAGTNMEEAEVIDLTQDSSSFSSEYESLVVDESRWFAQMNAGTKKSHMKKVFSQNPINALTPMTNPQSTLVDETGPWA